MKLSTLSELTLGAIFSACRAALSYPVSMAAAGAPSVGANLNRDENRLYDPCSGWARSRRHRPGGRTGTQLMRL